MSPGTAASVAEPDGPSPNGAGPSRRVLQLDDRVCEDPAVSGSKAAALSRLRRQGIRTVGGVVVGAAPPTTRGGGSATVELADEVLAALGECGPGDGPWVVRSSSVAEDLGGSSMAGRYDSVVGVDGADELAAALEVVLASASRAGSGDEPMAVLVQPLVEPAVAGVLFGVDPVSGRTDHRVVAAVRGRPDRLVSGEVEGSRWVLDRDGRVVEERLVDGAELPAARLSGARQ